MRAEMVTLAPGHSCVADIDVRAMLAEMVTLARACDVCRGPRTGVSLR